MSITVCMVKLARGFEWDYYFGNENDSSVTAEAYYDYDRIFLGRFQCYQTGTVDTLSEYLGGGAGTACEHVRAVMYSDNEELGPDVLLGIGTELALEEGVTQWYNWTVSIPVEVGEYYWIGIIIQTDGVDQVASIGYSDIGDNYYVGPVSNYPSAPYPVGELALEEDHTLMARAYFDFDDTQITPSEVFEGYDVVTDITTPLTIRWQDKSFYSAGRYWIFYQNGTWDGDGKTWYTSSPNGDIWDTPTNITNGANLESSGENLQVLYNDGYVEVFIRGEPLASPINYRRGLPNSDGTITWIDDWQTAWNPGGSNADFYACLDSNGYIWISWSIGSLGSTKTYVSKNSVKDGTWSTASGYPVQVSDAGTITTNNFLMPMTNGKMYCIYFSANTALYGKLYNPSTGWGDQEQISESYIREQYATAHESWSRGAVVDSENNLYVVYLTSGHHIVSVIRDYDSGEWSGEQTVYPLCGDFSSPALYIQDDYVQCFWIYNYSYILYKNYLSTGYWSEYPIQIIYEEDNFALNADPNFATAGYDGRLMSFVQTLKETIGMFWVSEPSEDSFTIKFYPLAPPTPDVSYYEHLETQGDIVLTSGGHTLTVMINSGTLNGTDVSIALTDRGGTMTFNSWTDAEIQLSGDYQYQVSFDGFTLNELERGFEYYGDIPDDGSVVSFSWKWKILMPHEENWNLFLGIAGIGVLLGSLLFDAFLIKSTPFFSFGKREILFEKESFFIGIVGVVIGFALIMMWLMG